MDNESLPPPARRPAGPETTSRPSADGPALAGRPAASEALARLQRYRTLCEAQGLARARGLPLADSARQALADLERQLATALTAAPAPATRATSSAPTSAPSALAIPEPAPAGAPRPARPATPASAARPSAPATRAAPGSGPAAVPASTSRATAPASPATPAAVAPPGTPTPPATPEARRATIFTDGAAEGNPGPGGFCALVRLPGQADREVSGGVHHTTNNQMEMTAAIVGLKAAIEAGATDFRVITDSEYLLKGMTQWLAGWQRNGWKTASGQPVKNRELWEELAALTRGRSVAWEWTRGHAGHPENERCDAVASAAARAARD
jgi:ribonuclease HI